MIPAERLVVPRAEHRAVLAVAVLAGSPARPGEKSIKHKGAPKEKCL